MGLLTRLFWPASWPPMSDLWSIDPAALPGSIDPVLYRRLYRINLGYHLGASCRIWWAAGRPAGIDARTLAAGRWIGGLVAGVVAAAALLTVLGPLLRPVARAAFADEEIFVFVGQVIFFTVYGSVVGLVAGWVSKGAARELVSTGGTS